MTTTMLDAIRDAYLKNVAAHFPHAECETCDRATRTLEQNAEPDGFCRYIFRVECNHECEADDEATT